MQVKESGNYDVPDIPKGVTVDKKSTGYQSGIGYDLPPIGAAEILESCDEQTEFGIPEGLPYDYIGTTPPPERIITVSRRT